MPWTTDSNGKTVWEGNYPDETTPVATVEAEKPAQKPERITPDKPWWQQGIDAVGNAAQELIPQSRYIPNIVDTGKALLSGESLPQVDRLKNDVQFELNQLSKPETALPRLQHLVMKGTLQNAGMSNDLANTYSLGGATASANATKALVDVGPDFGSETYKLEQEGQLDQELDNYYRAQGEKPRSEMNETELAGDEMRSSLVLNTALSVLAAPVAVAAPLAAVPFAAKIPFVGGTLAKALPFVSRGFARLDPGTAKTFMGSLGRMVGSNILDEPLSTFLDDNTPGSFFGNLGPDADPVKPGMTRTEASQAALIPNFVGAVVTGGGLLGTAKGLDKLFSRQPNLKRTVGAKYKTNKRQKGRDTVKNDYNVYQEDDAGKTSFTEEVLQPEVAESVEGRVLTNDGTPAVTGETAPTAIEYDPAIPEVDAAYEAIEGGMSDAQLDEAALLLEQDGVSVTAAIEQVSQGSRLDVVNEDMAYEAVAAPGSKLVKSSFGTISDRFSSVSTQNLLSLASPQTSPGFSEAITEATGKDWPNFDRIDILDTIERLEPDGRTVMPSRLMGQPMLLTSEIEVAPEKFQFKQGTDAETGEQKGNSLDGVDVWNEDMEGTIQVWTDPMDGKTYVVNGHNRLAKARKLGIPSMRVDYINAPKAEVARAKGAITNIAQGGGTPFDAAKFMRDSGITEPAQLEALGVPMRSGLATEGLALSRLPDNIFQDAIDGRVSKGKALALGGSGLDETGMQQAYKALQSRDMTDSTFNEVLQQARSAPTVQGDQVDLFGNTDMLNLMVRKGELAGRIRKDLAADKSLMSRTAKNAKRLTEVGNEIDRASTATLADDTDALLKKFDADKYMDGSTSQLLNEGAEQIENGAKVKVVADRIRRQLIEEAENFPAPEKAAAPAAEEVVEEIPRKAKVKKILSTGAKRGELRPPTTPLVATPSPNKVDTNGKRADVAVLEGLDNEGRLGEEWAAIDDAMEADQIQDTRKAIGYDAMTFEEKKANGLLDGMTAPEQARPEARAAFVIPKDLSKSAPRYGMAQLKFESDLDRAAYMIRDKAKKSKGEDRMIAALEEQGYDVDEIRKLGAEVKTRIGDGIQEATGTRRAPQEAMTIEVPASTRDGAPSLSRTGPQLSRTGAAYDEGQYRKKLERIAEFKKYNEEAALLDIGMQLPVDAARMVELSETLGSEMIAGLKDAARISGLDPLRIQYLDTIDTRKLFGDANANSALRAWDENAARFAKENPNDPLTPIADGGTNGVFVSRNFASIHRHMIYLAMGPTLDNRLKSRKFSDSAGIPMGRTAYHEAFHAVQDWLRMMGNMEPFDSLAAKSIDMEYAMSSDEAIAEMTKLVKNDRFGNYQEGMELSELQAEAFATWYNNRKTKLKAGGLQAAFENIKKFINTLRRKWKIAFEKDLSYVDVFELAAAGKIADKGNAAIAKLRPEQLEALSRRIDRNMDQLLPGLTDRVHDYLKQKQADFVELGRKIVIESDVEGC